MSWLNTIYKNIITEISADDAYTRFYSNMPREDYDAILDGDPNPDKFVQFMLNNVRDGKATKEDAILALNAFKSADQLVKNNVKNKFAAGEYGDVYDIIGDIKYLSEGNAILSRKKFAKEGFIKIKENENWVATCTTNYLANNHYFGKTHWCTASDRNGRWDGYRMFLSYGYPNYILVQFTWKKTVKEAVENQEYTDIDDYLKYSTDNGVVTDEINWQDQMFQVQLDRYGNIGQICNFMDRSLHMDELSGLVGKDMFSVLKDTGIIGKLFEIALKQGEQEKKYQEAVTDIINMKKKRKRERQAQMRRVVEAQVFEINSQKKQVALQQWNEFIANKGWEDPELIKNIIRRGDKDPDELTDEDYNQTHHVISISNSRTKYGRVITRLGPCIGICAYTKAVWRDDDEEELDHYEIDYGVTTEVIETGHKDSIFVSYDPSNIDRTLDTVAIYDEYVSFQYVAPATVDEENERRFFAFDKNDGQGFDVYDAMYNRTFKTPSEIDAHIRINENQIMFFNRSYNNFCFIYDGRTGEVTKKELVRTYIDIVDYGEALSIRDKEHDVQYLYCPNRNLFGLKIPNSFEINSFQAPGGRTDIITPGMIVIVYFDAMVDYANAVIVGKEGFIFGFDATNVYFDLDDDNNRVCCGIKYLGRKLGERVVLYSDGKYRARVKVKKPNGDYYYKEIPCDREGNTIDEKNLENWKGYSDQTKAEMDQMWANRKQELDTQNPDDNGRAAMSAWRDEDNPLSKSQLNKKYISADLVKGIDDKIDAGLNKLEPDPNWSGYVGVTDPYSKEFRGRPFYRIDRFGRPMDQPWYDEDEVPANLSDRIVRENRINESVNKMMSIWDRMGLNE